MQKFCSNLKTSDKITFLFTIFNFISLLILLIWINIIYFFIWYSDQKAESWYDMNINYNNYIEWKSDTNLKAFKEYILKKDTLIIPVDWWELLCSLWVENKIHSNIDIIKNNLFYNNWEKVFFIYTKTYPEIWEVKVFFDTTPYVKSQLIIIKISFFIIFFSLFIYYVLGKKITQYSFKNLKNISWKAKNLDIEKDFKKIKILWNKEDEINILAWTINDSFTHIKNQTYNLKQFITDVSHEFKTPLMVINSQIDLYNKKLEKWKLNKTDTDFLLKKIKERTAKLNSLLETFFILSRIENNIEILETSETNLEYYLKTVVDNYILNNDLKVEIRYKLDNKVILKIEENTFNVLFENVLSNAIKFSDKNIKIEIWCNKNSFWIKDNWKWIEKDKLEQIWNKFYRNDTNIEWFGVWLFLVKRLAELYNWKIELKSKVGKWSVFIFKF